VRVIQIYESTEYIYIYIFFYTHVYVYTIHMYLRTYDQLRVDRRNRICVLCIESDLSAALDVSEIGRSIFHCELVPISDSTISLLYTYQSACLHVCACVRTRTCACVMFRDDEINRDRETSIEGNMSLMKHRARRSIITRKKGEGTWGDWGWG
jgi:hypothetical protein